MGHTTVRPESSFSTPHTYSVCFYWKYNSDAQNTVKAGFPGLAAPVFTTPSYAELF